MCPLLEGTLPASRNRGRGRQPWVSTSQSHLCPGGLSPLGPSDHQASEAQSTSCPRHEGPEPGVTLCSPTTRADSSPPLGPALMGPRVARGHGCGAWDGAVRIC